MILMAARPPDESMNRSSSFQATGERSSPRESSVRTDVVKSSELADSTSTESNEAPQEYPSMYLGNIAAACDAANKERSKNKPLRTHEEAVQARRLANRKSAKLSRDRKKNEVNELEQRILLLTQLNSQLTLHNQYLEKQLANALNTIAEMQKAASATAGSTVAAPTQPPPRQATSQQINATSVTRPTGDTSLDQDPLNFHNLMNRQLPQTQGATATSSRPSHSTQGQHLLIPQASQPGQNHSSIDLTGLTDPVSVFNDAPARRNSMEGSSQAPPPRTSSIANIFDQEFVSPTPGVATGHQPEVPFASNDLLQSATLMQQASMSKLPSFLSSGMLSSGMLATPSAQHLERATNDIQPGTAGLQNATFNNVTDLGAVDAGRADVNQLDLARSLPITKAGTHPAIQMLGGFQTTQEAVAAAALANLEPTSIQGGFAASSPATTNFGPAAMQTTGRRNSPSTLLDGLSLQSKAQTSSTAHRLQQNIASAPTLLQSYLNSTDYSTLEKNSKRPRSVE